MGPKGTPNKSEIQGRMSTVTYLMKATFSAVTGIAAIDNGFDDDGNADGTKELISVDQATEINDLIKETDTKLKVFLKVAKAESVEAIPQSSYPMLIKQLKNKKEKMEKEKTKEREPGQEG
jgi:hypothetical protein